jgi:hypothetical protein
MQIGNYPVDTISKVSTTLGSTAGLYGQVGVTTKTAIDFNRIASFHIDELTTSQHIFYTFKFDNEYKIYKDSNWITIVRDNGGIFEYLDATSTMIPATVNEVNAALSEATTLSTNQMNSTEVNAIPFGAFSVTPSELTVTFGVGSEDDAMTGGQLIGIAPNTYLAGKDIKWRITTDVSVPITIHGIRLRW